jgi:hypothetical protein
MPTPRETPVRETTGRLGYLLAKQLVGAGGQVLDVPATQAARRAHCPFWSLIR